MGHKLNGLGSLNTSNLFIMGIKLRGLHIHNCDIEFLSIDRIFIDVLRESAGNEFWAKCFIICSYTIMAMNLRSQPGVY